MRLLSFLRVFFFFSSRRRHTRFDCDWSSDVCSSDLTVDVATATVRLSKDVKIKGQLAYAELTPAGLLYISRPDPATNARSEERRVGKSVDLGGRRIIKKKKNREHRRSKA